MGICFSNNRIKPESKKNIETNNSNNQDLKAKKPIKFNLIEQKNKQ